MPATQIDFLRALYDHFPDPVIFTNADRIIVAVNQAAEMKFGYAATELVSGSAQVLYATVRDFERAAHWFRAIPPGDAFAEGIYRYRHRDETQFTARLRVTRVAGAEGQTMGYVGVIHDISDYLDLDRERKRASEILDTALQTIPEGFAIYDKDERLIVFNDAYRRICGAAGPKLYIGITADEVMRAIYEAGQYPMVRLGSEAGEAWIEKRMRDFRNPEGGIQVFQYGTDRWLRVEDLKMPDGNNVVLCIDVTELKETELALDRKRLEYYSLIRNLPDYIVRLSRDKICTFANDHYGAFMGEPAEALIGRSLAALVPELEREGITQDIDGLTPEAPMIMVERRRFLPDGRECWLLWCDMAIFQDDQLIEYVCVGRDITELKLQQTRIAQQSAELQRKNDALSQFTGTVSHDLKGPLRHMSMFSEMICDDVGKGRLDDLPLYAQHLRQSARRMNKLVDSLLEYSQITDQIAVWSVIRPADAINTAILNLDSFIREADARFEIGDLPEIKGDAELIKGLFQNLIGNAVKYRKENTTPIIKIYGEKCDGLVRIYFQDNGIGIEPRFRTKIFDVFQRLHRDESTYPGTGIGLALAKRIAESHNGTIELDTTFTQGARFVLTLPEMN